MSPLTAVLCAMLLFPPADKPEQKQLTPAQITQAIKELGDSRFATREAASNTLWSAGAAVEPALREAAESKDLEVASRARVLLSNLAFGIRPDTPPEVIELIDQYRYGEHDEKINALDGLRKRGDVALLFLLIRSETDPKLRKEFSLKVLTDTKQVIPKLLVEGKEDEVEQLLAMGATLERGPRDYAVYLQLRGKADAKLAELQAPNRVADDAAGEPLLIATLLRVKGDLPAAWKAAEKTKDLALQRGILFEQRRWSDLAKMYDDPTAKQGIETRGYRAAYHRLAGDEKAFDEDLETIGDLAKLNPDGTWYDSKVLLLLDRPEQAIDALREKNDLVALELLLHQERYTNAFALLGIEQGQLPNPAWLKEYEFKSPDDQNRRSAKGLLGVKLAQVLNRLGKKNEAQELLAAAVVEITDDEDLSALAQAWKAMQQLGQEEQAMKLGAKLLAQSEGPGTFQALFPAHSEGATRWWAYFCKKYPDEPRHATLQRLVQLFLPPPRGPSADEWQQLVDEAEEMATLLSPQDGSVWLASIGHIYLLRGERTAAHDFYVRAAIKQVSPAICMTVADMLFEDRKWPEAANWYHSAWELDTTKALPLYLHGYALLQADPKSAEGRKAIELALLMPLGDPFRRDALAEGLRKHGLRNEAIRQWELLLRTVSPEETSGGGAAQHLGNALSGYDDLGAADRWDQSMIRIFQTRVGITSVEGYLQLPHLIHKIRGRGLLKAGKIDEALAELQLAQTALPADVDLAIDLVPQLEAANRQADADALFEKIYAANDTICRDFPEAGSAHNNTAWLAAKCRHRLDDALAHAERAVAIAPENPAFIDTLAEVHFQRGDQAKAVELSKQAVALAPNAKVYREQLTRFEGKKP